MNLPAGTSDFLSHFVGMAVMGAGGILWARGTISGVVAIGSLVLVHCIAYLASQAEPERDTA